MALVELFVKEVEGWSNVCKICNTFGKSKQKSEGRCRSHHLLYKMHRLIGKTGHKANCHVKHVCMESTNKHETCMPILMHQSMKPGKGRI